MTHLSTLLGICALATLVFAASTSSCTPNPEPKQTFIERLENLKYEDNASIDKLAELLKSADNSCILRQWQYLELSTEQQKLIVQAIGERDDLDTTVLSLPFLLRHPVVFKSALARPTYSGVVDFGLIDDLSKNGFRVILTEKVDIIRLKDYLLAYPDKLRSKLDFTLQQSLCKNLFWLLSEDDLCCLLPEFTESGTMETEYLTVLSNIKTLTHEQTLEWEGESTLESFSKVLKVNEHVYEVSDLMKAIDLVHEVLEQKEITRMIAPEIPKDSLTSAVQLLKFLLELVSLTEFSSQFKTIVLDVFLGFLQRSFLLLNEVDFLSFIDAFFCKAKPSLVFPVRMRNFGHMLWSLRKYLPESYVDHFRNHLLSEDQWHSHHAHLYPVLWTYETFRLQYLTNLLCVEPSFESSHQDDKPNIITIYDDTDHEREALNLLDSIGNHHSKLFYHDTFYKFPEDTEPTLSASQLICQHVIQVLSLGTIFGSQVDTGEQCVLKSFNAEHLKQLIQAIPFLFWESVRLDLSAYRVDSDSWTICSKDTTDLEKELTETNLIDLLMDYSLEDGLVLSFINSNTQQ